MKKRGFTLIELLAVIVILAIIALIATPMVLNTIDEARKGAAKASATSYIEAIENKVATSLIEGKEYEDKEDYAYDEIEVEVKGTIPTGGIYSLKNGVVVSGTFCVNGYEVSYADNKTEVQGNCTGDELKLNGSATLSSTSGTVEKGLSTTVTVSNATGTLSCQSSNSSVATCSVSGTTVTVTGVAAGTATITINVAESTNYTATNKTYIATVKTLLSTVVSVGDYVKMTPTSTSYTVPASLTGYTSVNGYTIDQTINPSELNVWRVIKINDDGTIETVSENVSSVAVYFTGEKGYKNLVGTLNTIAKQYENSNYTIGSRHMGYNGQTEYLTDTANTVDSTSTTAPWTSSTSDNSNEAQGGGDTLYTTDTNLVESALGTLKATNPSGTAEDYWLASRRYGYGSWTSYWYYLGRFVKASGSISSNYLYNYESRFYSSVNSGAVRPIVTLKSGLTATGSGTSADPWVLG